MQHRRMPDLNKQASASWRTQVRGVPQELLREVRQQLKDSQERAELAQAEAQDLRGQLADARQGAAEQQQRSQEEATSMRVRPLRTPRS